jgi:hypothetical protein
LLIGDCELLLFSVLKESFILVSSISKTNEQTITFTLNQITMLKITVDLFSGRPNPTWIMHDTRADELLKQFASNTQIISKEGVGYNGLGFRGIKIELLSDEDEDNLPSTFVLANGVAEDQKTSLSIARAIVEQMSRYEKFSMDIHKITPVNREMQRFIMGSIESYERDLEKIRKYIHILPKPPRGSNLRTTVSDMQCQNCQYEESKFNPNFWNTDAFVRANNNCYNYGRNWKTNTFAQPGRFTGHVAAAMTCAEVKAAAMRDGLRERCNCLPQSEYPRRLMALVVAPGRDYHWYRKQKDGFWGHKPGGTAARNIDNSGVIITDPQTCDRGAGTFLNYIDFCGFFYAGKSVIIS